MIEAFSIPFFTIFLAEFLDKSQLAVLLLATKTKKYLSLLVGVIIAFAIVDGLAVVFGSIAYNLLPHVWLKIASGLLFILFGIKALADKDLPEKEEVTLKSPLISGFLLVFVSEWGDKTQLASALFATKYPPLPVFLGVMLAMILLAILAILVGNQLVKKVNKKTISTVSGLIFILLGIVFLL